MKTFAKPLMIAAALSIATTPALAQSAAKPGAAATAPRAATATQNDSDLAGAAENSTFVYAVIGAILIVAAVLIATNDTPTDTPTSP